VTNTERNTDYMAFISYSHSDNNEEDRLWATWLHQQLEVYDIPADLIDTVNDRGEIIPERIYPVFRDEVSLPANADLSTAITRALDASQFLVVLCSPHAIQSKYVREEIIHFKVSGKSDRVIAALLYDDPDISIDSAKLEDSMDIRTLECFPEPLLYEIASDGKLEKDKPREPLAADFRLPNGGKGVINPSLYKQRLLESGQHAKEAEQLALTYEEAQSTAKLKIIAGILGVNLDILMKRDKVHQLAKEREISRRRRIVGSVMTALALIAGLGGSVAWWQYREAESLLSSARQNLSYMIFDLREVMDRYVPTESRLGVSQQIDSIVDTLKAHGGSSDILNIAFANIQKSDQILRSDSQDPALALPLLEEAHMAIEKLVEEQPSNIGFQHGLSMSYQRLGDIKSRVGNTEAALVNFENSHAT